MPEETAVAEVFTEPEAAAVEPTQPEVKTEEAPPDYPALLKAAQGREALLEQQLRTVKGQLKPKLDTEATLTGIRREIRSQNARIDAILKGQISGDPQVAQQEWERAQQSHQAEDLQDAFRAQLLEQREFIEQDVEDAGLTMSAPELAEAQRLWEEGARTQNLTLVRTAAKMVRDIRRGIQTREYQEREAAERKRNGSLTMPIPKASGSGSGGGYVEKLKSGAALPPPEEIDRLTAKYLR